jgi:NADH dehydrogenase
MSEADFRQRTVFLTGGTGFVGGYVARRLAERGHSVRAFVRAPERAEALRELGAELVAGDISDPMPGHAMTGCDVAVHLVGIIKERPPSLTFERVHTRGTEQVLEAAAAAGVKKFVHMSALGSGLEGTAYQRTKHEAEELVRRSGIPHVIFRPSIIVGPGGEFTDLLTRIVRHAPVIPVIGDGSYRLQPVDVEDVAAAIILAAERDELKEESYDLGGPHKLTYNRMVEIVCEELGARRRIIHVPVSLVRPFVDLASNWRLPTPVTSDQLDMLFQESIVPGDDSALRDVFGLEPTSLRAVMQRCAAGTSRAARP